MRIYKLANERKGFQVLQLNAKQIADQLKNRKMLRRVSKMGTSSAPMLADWGRVAANYAALPNTRALNIPDISIWSKTTLVFSPKAYDKLHQALAAFGEFLPIQVENCEYYLFHLMVEGVVDPANSHCTLDRDGIPDTVTALRFEAADSADKLLFKSRFEFYLSVFCHEKFKILYDDNNFQGLKFDQNLAHAF